MSGRLRLSWGGATHAGRVRSANQDALFADHGLFVVADGMGGHQGGEVASRIAVRAMSGLEHAELEDLVEGVVGANAAVWEYAQKNPELMGMGTTVTAIAVIGSGADPKLALVNVGDSRVYQWREGTLSQLTDDHSYVAELVRRGQLDPTEAETHPYRNMLTRAIGVGEEVDVDSWEISPELGDRYILCSDGLVNEVSDPVIGSIVASNADPSEVAKLLIEQANAAGGRDNITVVVVNIDAEPAPATAADEGDAAQGESVESQPIAGESSGSANSLDTGVFVPVSGSEPTVELPIEAPADAPTTNDLFSAPVSEDELPIVTERSNPLATFDLPEHDGASPLPWSGGQPAPTAVEQETAEAPAVPDGSSLAEPTVPDPTEVVPVPRPEPGLHFSVPDDQPSQPQGADAKGWNAPLAVTWRHLAGVALVLLIIGGGLGLTGWYARSAYHVGFAGDEVVIYQGREGGVLWFDRTLEEGSGIYRSQLPDATVAEIEDVVEVSSLEAARAFIEGVRPQGQ